MYASIFRTAQQLPLLNMFTRILEMTNAASVSTPSNRFGEIAHSYATVRLLEECTTACEMMAEELDAEDPANLAMQDLLSDCIASCGAFLGATVRESPYAPRYALLCGEICAETASACSRRLELASRCCEVLCRACANLVDEGFAAALAN